MDIKNIDSKRMKEEIGARLKEARLKRGYSQDEIAEILHVSRSAVAYIETGKVNLSLESFMRICDAIDIPYSFFFKDKVKGDSIESETLSDTNYDLDDNLEFVLELAVRSYFKPKVNPSILDELVRDTLELIKRQIPGT